MEKVAVNVYFIWLATRCELKRCSTRLSYVFLLGYPCVWESATAVILLRFLGFVGVMPDQRWKCESMGRDRVTKYYAVVDPCVALNHLLLKVYNNGHGHTQPYNSFENLWKPLLRFTFKNTNYTFSILIWIFHRFKYLYDFNARCLFAATVMPILISLLGLFYTYHAKYMSLVRLFTNKVVFLHY